MNGGLITLLSVAVALLIITPLLFQPVSGQQGSTYLFSNLQNQAFPQSGKPGALVYVPTTFALPPDPSSSFSVVVYIHGFQNCIENCVLAVDQNTNCSVGQPPRGSYGLIEQIEVIRLTNTLLLLPEVAYDQRSSDPGNFGKVGGWAAFLNELFATDQMRNDVFNGLLMTTDNIADMIVFSHSGAYVVAGDIATIGNVTAVREVVLLDSLYGDFGAFDSFIQSNIQSFGVESIDQYRFANVYTDNGGTYNNSLAQELRVSNWMAAAGLEAELLFDNTYDTLPPSAYNSSAVIFKRSALPHDHVPRYYFQQFIAGSNLQ